MLEAIKIPQKLRLQKWNWIWSNVHWAGVFIYMNWIEIPCLHFWKKKIRMTWFDFLFKNECMHAYYRCSILKEMDFLDIHISAFKGIHFICFAATSSQIIHVCSISSVYSQIPRLLAYLYETRFLSISLARVCFPGISITHNILERFSWLTFFCFLPTISLTEYIVLADWW